MQQNLQKKQKKNITKVYFDRGVFKYHGRIKIFAETLEKRNGILNGKNNSEFIDKLVHINRITKVVKGGRRFGFSALVVVGNQNGQIGVAHAKAKQVPV